MSAVAIEVRDKLKALGGTGPLKCTIGKARERLSQVHPRYWRASQSFGRIKRFLYLEQRPSYEEIRDVRAAYVLMNPEKIRKCRRENAELIQNIIDFATQARGVDEEFYRQHLAAIKFALIRAGCDEAYVGKLSQPQLSSE